jgi:hypothetical protein
MANKSRYGRLSLLLLVVSACAQGIDSVENPAQEPSTNTAGADGAGASGQAGAGTGTILGAGGNGPNGGSGAVAGAANVAGSAGAGSSSGGASAGSAGSSSGGASAGSAGSAKGGSSNAAGSSNGGASAGAGGASSAGSGGNNAGGGGASAAPCSGKKPEANCTCQSYSNHDYWFCPTARNFVTSEANCVSASLHLARVTSAAEDKWLNDAANAASFGEYWLGSTDSSTPNTWTWLAGGTFWTGVANGTVSGYAHWNSGEPNASGDCVVVQTGSAWDDRICTDQRKYICD